MYVRPRNGTTSSRPYVLRRLCEAGALSVLAWQVPGFFRVEAGFAAVGVFVVMQAYSLRQLAREHLQVGDTQRWQHFHMFMGGQMALFAIYHALPINTPTPRRVKWLALGERVLRRWIWCHRPLLLLLAVAISLHVVAYFAYRGLGG